MSSIRPVDLARHWGVGRGYVTNLRKGRGMPEFESLEAADAWRAEHAPPRGRRIASPSATAAAMTQPAGVERSFQHNHNSRQKPQQLPPEETIDTAQYLVRGDGDFDALMVAKAEEAALLADGLYRRACSLGDPVRISGALKNLNEAMRHAADQRERYMGLQVSAKLVAPIDKLMDVIGTQLKEVQLLLTGMGARIGPDANPSDPTLGQRVIDAEVDRIFAQLANAATAIRAEAVAA